VPCKCTNHFWKEELLVLRQSPTITQVGLELLDLRSSYLSLFSS
jgi:hypothetical protein